jgi:hypothetical protein
MARFVIEKLPAHWLFVPSKRQMRELMEELGADVRLVEFYGTSYSRMADRLSLGFVESRVVKGSWCFYLHLWGVREALAGPVREELAMAALAKVRQYIRQCASQLPADTIKPAQLSLSFCVNSEGVSSKCRVKVVDRYSYPTRAWWECGSPA